MVLLLMSAALLAVAATGPASAPPDLKRAEALFARFKYAEARTALTKARGWSGLDRATLLHILELQGLAAGHLRQAEAATAAFHELLVLDPQHVLGADYAPRVMTPFFEARRKLAETGALEFHAGPVQASAQRVQMLSVALGRDPLRMGRLVRFHVKAGGGWRTVEAPLAADKATAPVDGAEVTWWAELLGDSDVQLALEGTEVAPRIDRPPAPAPTEPVMVALPVVAPPVVTPPGVAALPVVAAPSARVEETVFSPLRITSCVVLGSALVAAGAGGLFGLRSADAFRQLDVATTSAIDGRVTTLTERQAWALDANGRQWATAANALFVSASVVAAVGVVLWLLGAPSASRVAIVPAWNGAGVSASF